MATTVDELTMNYEENGVQVVKELDKHVLTKGAWSTIMYKYQDWDNRKEEYGPIKFSVRRYQKSAGEYKQRSKFNISNAEQAQKMIDVLTNWLK